MLSICSNVCACTKAEKESIKSDASQGRASSPVMGNSPPRSPHLSQDGCFGVRPGGRLTVTQQTGALPPSSLAKNRRGSNEPEVPETTPEDVITATEFPKPKELISQVVQSSQIFQLAAHDFCIFGSSIEGNRKGQAVIEPEFEEKTLEISPTGSATDLRKELADIGVAICCKKGRKSEQPNQDNVLFCKMGPLIVCGIADGHGPDGHWASHWTVRIVLRLFMAEMGKTGIPPADDVIKRIFDLTHQSLCAKAEDSGFDLNMSGTTLSVCIVDSDEKHLVAAWAGDSRCAVGDAAGGSGVSVTHDHKPQDKEEKQRIHRQGGEVVRLEGDVPHRVFVRNGEVPGLAMSRAVGDCIAHSIGVIHEPDIVRHQLDSHVLLCCSDGVWEFIESPDATRMVSKMGRGKVRDAAEVLVKEARNRWLTEEVTVTDDISAICIYVG